MAKRITKDKIAKLRKIEREANDLKARASDLLAQAKLNKDVEHKVKRGDSEVMIPEASLWDEVWRLGKDCQAGKILQEEYPEVFDVYNKQGEKAQEIDDYFAKEFGFNFSQITPSRLIDMVEAIIDYKNAK